VLSYTFAELRLHRLEANIQLGTVARKSSWRDVGFGLRDSLHAISRCSAVGGTTNAGRSAERIGYAFAARGVLDERRKSREVKDIKYTQRSDDLPLLLLTARPVLRPGEPAVGRAGADGR
jgi:hypothetical protein